MKLITLDVTEFDLQKLNELVALGRYPNRAEAIRMAIHDMVKSELLKSENLSINVVESGVEIREDGEVYMVEIMREKDGKIWGIYPNKPNSPDCISVDSLRNMFILFQRGILKLDDFQRYKKKDVKPK